MMMVPVLQNDDFISKINQENGASKSMETNDKDGKEHEDRLAVLNILVNASQVRDSMEFSTSSRRFTFDLRSICTEFCRLYKQLILIIIFGASMVWIRIRNRNVSKLGSGIGT
jgi:hypothetical protein